MSLVAGSSIILLSIIMLLFLAIPTIIGVFVYRDSKARGMNAPLWTLVAIFAPGFIGLIIYLIVRAEHSSLLCPVCAYRVNESFSVCPNCTSALKHKCPNCSTPLEGGWKVCPSCSEPVHESTMTALCAKPMPKNDKGLGKLLILIILVPLLLCGLLLLPLLNYRMNMSSHQSLTKMESLDIELFGEKPWVADWIEDCTASGHGFYVLSYDENLSDDKKSAFLIYRTGLDTYTETSIYQSNGGIFSSPKINLAYTDFSKADSPPYHLTYIEYIGKKQVDLKIELSGTNSRQEDISYILTKSGQDISPFGLSESVKIDQKPAKIVILNKQNLPLEAISIDYNSGTSMIFQEKIYINNPDDTQSEFFVDKTLFKQGVDNCVITLHGSGGTFAHSISVTEGFYTTQIISLNQAGDMILVPID